ncbi:hypothetical protein ACFQXB_08705 [Plastorhodobacter daqingensis]|uniref:Uncharacterized protein n=1 Tax=Plastorhodobacter daqingensis TaxID=1387281 RepID=A0ABW2UM37_9RHOB
MGRPAAAIFLSALGDIRGFAHCDKRAAHVGVVPRMAASNGVEQPAGQHAGPDKAGATGAQPTRCAGYLATFYRRITERRGAGKAITASAKVSHDHQ